MDVHYSNDEMTTDLESGPRLGTPHCDAETQIPNGALEGDYVVVS